MSASKLPRHKPFGFLNPGVTYWIGNAAQGAVLPAKGVGNWTTLGLMGKSYPPYSFVAKDQAPIRKTRRIFVS
jgi:hypothetical protein